jgi:hypothetical protein
MAMTRGKYGTNDLGAVRSSSDSFKTLAFDRAGWERPPDFASVDALG